MPLNSDSTQSYLNKILEVLRKLPTTSGGGGGGDASAANQVAGNNTLTAINNKTPSLGQTTGSASQPVVIASDQSSISVSVTNGALETGGNLAILAINGLVSTNNSTTATLTAGSTFTGTSEDVTQYGFISIAIFTDQVSATDGLQIQQSINGTNWDFVDAYNIPASTGKVFSVARNGKFVRVVYTNGATNQGTFRLQTIYTKNGLIGSSVRPQDGRTNDNDMQESLAYNMSYDPILNVWNRVQLQDLYITGQSAQTATINNIIPSTASASATDVVAYRAFAIQVVSTGTGGTFIFEGSNDNTNFQPIPVFNQALLVPIPIVTAITATSSQIIYVGATMFRYMRLRIATTITGGSIQAFSTLTQTPFSISQTVVAQGTAANLNSTVTGTVAVSSVTTSITPGSAAANLGKAEDAASASGDVGIFCLGIRRDNPVVSASANGDYNEIATNKWGGLLESTYEKTAKSYMATTNITIGSITTPTDIFTITGNATTNVYINRITISGTQTTAGMLDTFLIKRSTANTGGTSAGVTAIVLDSTDAAASATLLSYTVNPTALGTAVGTIKREYLPVPVPASAVIGAREWNFGDKLKQIVLIGTTQQLAINLNGVAAPSGGVLTITIEWFEI